MLKLRTELRDLHFFPLECKDGQTIDKAGKNSKHQTYFMKGNPVSRITIVIPSFASFISFFKQRKKYTLPNSIFLFAVSWGDVAEIPNNG